MNIEAAVEKEEKIPILHYATIALAIGLWMYVVYYAWQTPIPRPQFGIAFLGLTILVYVVDEIESDLLDRNYLSLSLMSVVGVVNLVVTYYMYTEFDAIFTQRIGFATDMDYLIAVLALAMVIYLTYREFGLPFVSVIFAALIYAYYGQYFPGMFEHTGLTWRRLLQIGVTEVTGVYGSLTQLMAAWIALFLLYAGLMQGYGAFDLILRAAVRIAGYIRSGVAQSAVVASMIIGSVNGSGTANAGITGSLTIPMMKESGLRGDTAGGIEAVASTGGQIMPPIMGAGAFLMAGILGIDYAVVLIAGIVPAAIFYFSTVAAVHFATADELEAAADDEITVETEKSGRQLAVEGLQFLIPFVVLIYYLAIAQYTVMTSALYTCIAMIVTGVLFPLLFKTDKGFVDHSISRTLEGLRIGALTTAPIAIIIAAINAIVDILLATGIPSTLAVTLAQATGGVLIFALILSLGICIILGLGMPTAAAYLVVATLVAPALINQFGVPELSAHFFVFYGAILATITPPIATGVAVTSGIAQANFWRTAEQALRIGAPLFVMPFMFIYHPVVVDGSIGLATAGMAVFGIMGGLYIVYGLNYPFDLNYRYKYLVRGLFAAGGLLVMVYPTLLIQIGLAVGIGVLIAVLHLNEATIIERMPAK